MALKVLGGIASDIAESAYYIFMADESTDASNIEQLVICIRVDKEMIVCEEYIGLMPVTRTNANPIAVCIPDVLLCMTHRIKDACGQCYDGCSTITGIKMWLLQKSRNWMKNVCWCTAPATHLILLSGIQ